jgi:SAM-dependent methyltransferase
VGARVSGGWRVVSGRSPGRWSVWRFNWLVNHQVIAALMRARPHAHGVLLDVGCGAKRFARWFRGHVTAYLGADLAASPRLRAASPEVFARGERLPFRAGSIDTVPGLSMLEHLPQPSQPLDEARRGLRPGGILLLEFPQMVPRYDEPHDYFRYTRLGAAWLLERSGFELLEVIPIGGLMTRVGLTTSAALNRLNRGPTRVLIESPVRALYVVLQLLFAGFDRLLFDPREVIAHLVVARRREPPPA